MFLIFARSKPLAVPIEAEPRTTVKHKSMSKRNFAPSATLASAFRRHLARPDAMDFQKRNAAGASRLFTDVC
jgi:hypothetical protein